MCRCVVYKKTFYCSQRQLAEICPNGFVFKDVVIHQYQFKQDPCLCSVDMLKTAEINGYVADESDKFNVVFRDKKPEGNRSCGESTLSS